MLKFESNTLLQCKRVLVVLGLSAALAGCALDDFANEDKFEPYGGSKQHPIQVVNGKAVVNKCGDWSENLADSHENNMAANHGCAVQSNLAALAANPNDLVRARKMSRAPAFTRTSAIKKLGGGSADASGGGAAAAPAAPTN